MPGDLAHQKQTLRATMKAHLAAIPQPTLTAHDAAINTLLQGWLLEQGPPESIKVRGVMLCPALPGEVDLTCVAVWVVSMHFTLIVPRMDWKAKTLERVRVRSWFEDLVTAEYNVRQPSASEPTIPLDRIDAVLVPGLAFDRQGGRLGRGAGFFDRFLATLPPRVLTIGVAYPQQVVDQVPMEPHDVRLRYLATPSGVLQIAK